MSRVARIVVPGIPHHITQRGNRRETIFKIDGDYELYRDLMADSCRRCGVVAWAYCLMPNHVHLILVPSTPEGLSRAVGEAHRRYTGYINARNRVTGHLFQGRFGSVAMDEEHLLAAIRYVSLNPVTAKLVRRARDWAWSSVRAHVAAKDDALVTVKPVLQRVANFEDFLKTEADAEATARLETRQAIGRPLMGIDALKALERKLKRTLIPKKRGPKATNERN